MAFEPGKLNVNEGDIVTWVNRGIVAHNVTEKNKVWASPTLNINASWKKVLTKKRILFLQYPRGNERRDISSVISDLIKSYKEN